LFIINIDKGKQRDFITHAHEVTKLRYVYCLSSI